MKKIKEYEKMYSLDDEQVIEIFKITDISYIRKILLLHKLIDEALLNIKNDTDTDMAQVKIPYLKITLINSGSFYGIECGPIGFHEEEMLKDIINNYYSRFFGEIIFIKEVNDFLNSGEIIVSCYYN